MPIVASAGVMPTTLEVRRKSSCSGKLIHAATNGSSSPSVMNVNDSTTPAPDTASGSTSVERHLGQRGCGGWMKYEHSLQRRNRSTPSTPDVQKNSLSPPSFGRAGISGSPSGG